MPGRPGAPITVALRPEAIVIGPSLLASLRRAAAGIVQSRSFLGCADAGRDRGQRHDPDGRQPGMLAVEAGDAIDFGWRDEDALALPADKSLPEEIQ